MEVAVGFSNAELQQRWRERQKAKVEALEARIRELEAEHKKALTGAAWLIIGHKNEHLKWRKLAKERERRLTAIKNAPSHRVGFMSKRLVRHIRASLHPDRATDPKNREELSKEFNSLTIVSGD
jgi:hypothetical protein